MQAKKILSMMLAVVMVVAMLPTMAFAADFTDTADHWAKAEIDKWSDLGIVQGNDGNFRPADSITRAEVAVIFDRIMKYQTKAVNTFTDLSDTWYTDALLRANFAGIFAGSDGKIMPTENITREQAAIVICRVFGLAPEDGATTFADDANISDWAKGYVKAAVTAKILTGVGDSNFAPKASIDRASVVKMLDNSIKAIYATAGEQTGTVEGNVIVNADGAILKNMTIKGALIIAEGVGNGEVTLENVTVLGNTIVRGGGPNSIIVKGDSKLAKIIVSKNDDGTVSVKVMGNAKVDVVVLEDGTIQISGNVGRVEVSGDVNVSLVGATVAEMNVTGKATVNVDKDSKVVKADVSGAGTTISGAGKVETINVKANDVSVATPNSKVVVASDVIGTKAGGKDVPAGGSATIDGSGNATVSGGNNNNTSGGGGGDMGGGSDNFTFAPTIKLNGTDVEKDPTSTSDNFVFNFVGKDGKISGVAVGGTATKATVKIKGQTVDVAKVFEQLTGGDVYVSTIKQFGNVKFTAEFSGSGYNDVKKTFSLKVVEGDASSFTDITELFTTAGNPFNVANNGNNTYTATLKDAALKNTAVSAKFTDPAKFAVAIFEVLGENGGVKMNGKTFTAPSAGFVTELLAVCKVATWNDLTFGSLDTLKLEVIKGNVTHTVTFVIA